MELSEGLKTKIHAAPKKPGVYQYFNKEGKIIYVGKAKQLSNRVKSYFSQGKSLSGKTRVLVSHIADIAYIITASESEALLLENSLIKLHQPRYNILLKDDKTYPWIVIKNEPIPRVFSTRNVEKDGSEYFGPYPSSYILNSVLSFIKKAYKLRSCSFNLSPENIKKGKFSVCLEYHIGNCLGPCVGLQSAEDYNRSLLEIRNLIKGNFGAIKKELQLNMKEAASLLNFELAEEIKIKYEALEKFQSKSTVVNPKINNVDVFSLIEEGDICYVNYLKVTHGAIVQSHTLEIKNRLGEDRVPILEIAITELRDRFNSQSKEVLLPFKIDFEDENIRFTVPKRGDKQKLIELSYRNAKYFMLERRKQHEKIDPERHQKRILSGIQKDLRLKDLPIHIECFDNSNIQGTNPVAACVVFKNAKPSKKDYRHFNIKTVVGPDDFASMEEAVLRRYSRLLEERESLPQLIVIDGGKGQLSSATKSLEKLGLRGKIAIIGIAKRLEEIYFPGDQYPLYLEKSSETLKVIQHLRNEAHRFGITHHRNQRSKASITSELDLIPGIGGKTKSDLLKKFKSVKRIKEASLDELKTAIPESRAKLIHAFFQQA